MPRLVRQSFGRAQLVRSTPAKMRWASVGECHLHLPRHCGLRRDAQEPLLSAFAVSSISWAPSVAPGLQQRWQQAAARGDIFPCLRPFSQEHAAARSPPLLQPPPGFSSHFSSLPQSFFCLRPQPCVACKFNKYALCFSTLAVNGSAQ